MRISSLQLWVKFVSSKQLVITASVSAGRSTGSAEPVQTGAAGTSCWQLRKCSSYIRTAATAEQQQHQHGNSLACHAAQYHVLHPSSMRHSAVGGLHAYTAACLLPVLLRTCCTRSCRNKLVQITYALANVYDDSPDLGVRVTDDHRARAEEMMACVESGDVTRLREAFLEVRAAAAAAAVVPWLVGSGPAHTDSSSCCRGSSSQQPWQAVFQLTVSAGCRGSLGWVAASAAAQGQHQ
jgi:hypothetical protein